METSPRNVKTLAATVASITFTLYLAVVCLVSLLGVVVLAGFCVALMVSFAFPDETANINRIAYLREMLTNSGWLAMCALIYALHWRHFRARVAKAESK